MKLVLPSKPWSANALDVVQKRYLSGLNLTVEEWLRRVAHHIAQRYPEPEKSHWADQYFQLLWSRTFLPTSAALHNSLRGQGGLAGCTVLPLPVDTQAIVQEALPQILGVLLHGTGVGLDLGVLPPRLSEDKRTGRAYPGPVEVLTAIVLAADGIMDYAALKRAAFMAGLPADHPDVFEFIHAKRQRRLRDVNTSVAVDSAFREALERDGYLPLSWYLNGTKFYLTPELLEDMHQRARQRAVAPPDLTLLSDGQVVSRAAQREVGREIGGILYVRAHVVLEEIGKSAHACGDPGLINLEAINKANPTHPRYAAVPDPGPASGVIRVTTPCGEQPLLPYEVCHLGSLNLNAFVGDGRFDFERLTHVLHLAVRLMDDIIDVGDNGLEISNQMARANRKIGIGIMGLADVLAELEIPYDSEQGREFAAQIVATIQQAAVEASRQLAVERGPFPSWEHSSFCKAGEPPRRHATLTTIAPTGHISTLADASTGIEPYFLISYLRNAAGLRLQTCPVLARKLAELGYSLQQWIEATTAKKPEYCFDGTLGGLADEPTDDPELNRRLQSLKRVFRTAHEISPMDHLLMVASLQRYVENGISKTINLPNAATVEDVVQIFRAALRLNLKGITVFRDGCLDQQALSRVESCPRCGETKYLRPSDCGGLKCDQQLGGCGYEACLL